MNALASRSAKLLLLGFIAAPLPVLNAADIVLHKVPAGTPIVAADVGHADSASVALVSYTRRDNAAARALYVSSGTDRAEAKWMIDQQTGTSYSFGAADKMPTAVIDLGKPSTLRRLSAMYTPNAGRMDFYVVQSIPGAEMGAADDVRFDDATLASFKSVGTAEDDGSVGRAAVEFAPTTGRFVILRWTPGAQPTGSFAIAEVSATAATGGQLLAANTASTTEDEDADRTARTSDGKTMMDGKTMIDAKDVPAEGPEEAPQSPGEGPPPTLPQPPPFTFVPVMVPASE